MPASQKKPVHSKSKMPVKKAAPKAKKLFRKEHDLRSYIFKILKQAHPELTISSLCMSTLNSMVLEVYRSLSAEAAQMSRKSRALTLSSQDVESAAKIVFPGEIRQHALQQATKSTDKFLKSKK